MNFYECCLFWFFWKDRNFLFYVHTFTCSSLISSATNFWINFVHVKPFLAWNLRCPEKKIWKKQLSETVPSNKKRKTQKLCSSLGRVLLIHFVLSLCRQKTYESEDERTISFHYYVIWRTYLGRSLYALIHPWSTCSCYVVVTQQFWRKIS